MKTIQPTQDSAQLACGPALNAPIRINVGQTGTIAYIPPVSGVPVAGAKAGSMESI